MKKVSYVLITNNEDIARAVKELVDNRKYVWWKFITKYYEEQDSREPYYTTTEESSKDEW